ncbi:MAG: hypothetical protein KME50_02805 [Nostoc desertorum CM1-VF14]|jgi:hypothetical protein|nr:hypothetical protein [Nostoc desertorum CM1-VF14]
MPNNHLPKTRYEIADKPKLRPYGSKVDIILGGDSQFGFDGESCLILGNELIVRLIPRQNKKFEFQKFTAYLEGFATASEAEEAGLKFAMSVLWAAVSLRCPLRLEYHTPLPCVVYDRTSHEGMSSYFALSFTSGASLVVEVLEQSFTSNIPINNKRLLVSMELFAAARLEATERAKFIGLVSALEPLAEQKKFEYPDLKKIVKDTLNKVQDSLDLPDDIKRSLEGSIRNLTRESVSHAIKHLIITHLTGDKIALEILEEAYTIRSKILHEGAFYPDLQDKSYKIENVIRRLYSAILGYELRDPAITYTNND